MYKSILVVSILIISGCGSSHKNGSPDDTAFLFVSAVLSDNGEYKYKLLAPDDQKFLKKRAELWNKKGLKLKPSDFLITKPASSDNWLGNKKQKILSSSKTKTEVEISTSLDSSPKVKIELTKIKNSWKVNLLSKK